MYTYILEHGEFLAYKARGLCIGTSRLMRPLSKIETGHGCSPTLAFAVVQYALAGMERTLNLFWHSTLQHKETRALASLELEVSKQASNQDNPLEVTY